MKIAGALTLGIGLLAAVVLMLLPASTTILGTEATCNPPVIDIFTSDDGPLLQQAVDVQCQNKSLVRIGIGGALVIVALGAGLPLMFVGGESRPATGREPQHH